MKTKKLLYTAGIVLAVIISTSINVTETKAGIFGKYGKEKMIYVPVSFQDSNGQIHESIGQAPECMYSLKSECLRSQD